MMDFVVRNSGAFSINIPNELLLHSKQTTVVSWVMLWKLLNACGGKDIVVYELGELLLDTRSPNDRP